MVVKCATLEKISYYCCQFGVCGVSYVHTRYKPFCDTVTKGGEDKNKSKTE